LQKGRKKVAKFTPQFMRALNIKAMDSQIIILFVSAPLAANDIAAGRLVQPFETRLPVRLSYHFVTSKQKARNAKVIAFREWVFEESAYLRNT